MGCSSSTLFSPPTPIITFEDAISDSSIKLERFGLHKDALQSLFVVFSKALRRRANKSKKESEKTIDIDDNKVIIQDTLDLESFFDHFSIPQTRMNERIFHVMDTTGTGELTFLQFSLTLWNYLTLGHRALIRLSFSLLDPDNTSFISYEDLGEVINETQGIDWRKIPRLKSVALGVEKISTSEGDGEGMIGLKSFERICNEYPNFLFPAFSAQLRLREAILGKSYWEREQKRREELSKFQAEKKKKAGNNKENGTASYSLWDVIDALDESAEDGKVGVEIQKLRKERFVPIGQEDNAIPIAESGIESKEKAALRRRDLYGGLRTAEILKEDSIVGNDTRLYERATDFEARLEEVNERQGKAIKARQGNKIE